MHDQLDGKLVQLAVLVGNFYVRSVILVFGLKRFGKTGLIKTTFTTPMRILLTLSSNTSFASASLVDTSEHSAWFRHCFATFIYCGDEFETEYLHSPTKHEA